MCIPYPSNFMFSKQRLKAFFSRKERYPEKLEKATQDQNTLCFPAVGSLSQETDIDEDFFDIHILKEQRDEGWFKSSNPKIPLIVEYGESKSERSLSANGKFGNKKSLKLISAPNYQPSFIKGLHSVEILSSSVGVNENFNQFNMYILEKPLVPKFSHLSQSTSSPSSSLSNIPSTVSTRLSSATEKRRRFCARRPEPLKKKVNPRQCSADSGYESPRNQLFSDSNFVLPPRITTYMESECYLANLPRCDQFIAHLGRNLRLLLKDLTFTSEENTKSEINNFAKVLHRLAQESTISFPRSTKTINISPRFQEFLRISVENIVVRLVHERIFPVICHLSKREDKELNACLQYLRKSGLSADQLGLPEDFCIPLSAAVVELSGLDMKTTPLDRMTCMYDSIEQIGNHIRNAIIESRGEDDQRSTCGLEDLPYPDDCELVLLLAIVIIQSRPKHLLATLNYADAFAWSVPADMIECIKLVQLSVDFLRNIQPKKLPPSSGKLKRDVSMEEIIQLTDEVQQSYDRRGNRLEPFKSALELHREKFAQRLELSAEEKNRKQEEAWALIDRCRTPLSDSSQQKRGFLARIHDKLICSTDSVEVVEK